MQSVPDVRQTIEAAMRNNGLGGYESRATPVVGALTHREQIIAENLLNFATSQGLAPRTALQALAEAGLTLPASSNGNSDDELADLRRKAQSVVDDIDHLIG